MNPVTPKPAGRSLQRPALRHDSDPSEYARAAARMFTELPLRAGSRPRTTGRNPREQLDQFAPAGAAGDLISRCRARLTDTTFESSLISGEQATALRVAGNRPAGPREAFLALPEYAHVHADASLHVALPPHLAQQAIARGWAELHPLVNTGFLPPTIVLLYGPRDPAEAGVIVGLLESSHKYATTPI